MNKNEKLKDSEISITESVDEVGRWHSRWNVLWSIGTAISACLIPAIKFYKPEYSYIECVLTVFLILALLLVLYLTIKRIRKLNHVIKQYMQNCPWNPVSRPIRYRLFAPNNGWKLLRWRANFFGSLLAGANPKCPDWPVGLEDVNGKILLDINSNQIKSKVNLFIQDDAGGLYEGEKLPFLLHKEVEQSSDAEVTIDNFVNDIEQKGNGLVITKSRMLNPADAGRTFKDVAAEIIKRCENMKMKKSIRWILRTESCLRTHLWEETEAICSLVDSGKDKSAFDFCFFVPAFLQQDRATVDGVHYSYFQKNKESPKKWAPIHESEHSKYVGHEYRESDLSIWLEDNSGKKINRKDVHLVSLDMLRKTNTDKLVEKLESWNVSDREKSEGKWMSWIVIDAKVDSDVSRAVNLMLGLEEKGKSICYRCSTSISNVFLNPSSSDRLVGNKEGLLDNNKKEQSPCIKRTRRGVLCVVGSLTSRTKRQVRASKVQYHISDTELEHLEGDDFFDHIDEKVTTLDKYIEEGSNVILTSKFYREEMNGKEPSSKERDQFLRFFFRVLQRMKYCPKAIVMKGSDTAFYCLHKGLGVRTGDFVDRPTISTVTCIAHQIKEGFEEVPLVLFAGNQGDDNELRELIKKLEEG